MTQPVEFEYILKLSQGISKSFDMDITIANWLWGRWNVRARWRRRVPQTKFFYLLIASCFILFTLLDARDIWTQEHRWAEIVSGMFYRHDFLHPYLEDYPYYDKPLLSYWLIALFAKMIGELNVFVLRLPSALAGLIAIFSMYRLGMHLRNKSFGLLAAWLLLTSFYFIFWSRTCSADMLNLAGSLSAITWYQVRKHRAHFLDYLLFFSILAFTSLCKGLVGAMVACIAVFVDLSLTRSWKKHITPPFFLSLLFGVIFYFLPFIAPHVFGPQTNDDNGLYMVYRENILRYFQPFDHRGGWSTYFIYLPIYLLPWTAFFIPALWQLPQRFHALSLQSKWIMWTLLLLFLFFSLSGSRRSYYILPLVPFAILFTADWLFSFSSQSSLRRSLSKLIGASYVLIFTALIFLPSLYYSHFGVQRFTSSLKAQAEKIKPWSAWEIILLQAESKFNFYLHLSPHAKNYRINDDANKVFALILKERAKGKHIILITRKKYMDRFKDELTPRQLVATDFPQQFLFFPLSQGNRPVALIL